MKRLITLTALSLILVSGVSYAQDTDDDGTKATDYNSSRSNKNGTQTNVLDKTSDADSKAQASQKDGTGNLYEEVSIKPIRLELSVAAPGSGGDTNAETEGTRAQDYNSSRSNRGDSQGKPKSTDATDYNSSRSNKADTVAAPDGDNGGNDANDDEGPATDYNSSRSNKADGNKAAPRPILPPPDMQNDPEED